MEFGNPLMIRKVIHNCTIIVISKKKKNLVLKFHIVTRKSNDSKIIQNSQTSSKN